MKPAGFAYHAPRSLEEALGLLGEHGEDAKVLAGGQSLIPMLNFRLAAPAHLVDINRVAGLGGFSLSPEGLSVAALVRQRQLETATEVALAYPVLNSALSMVAHIQIRNRGTVCGSLAHADAASELPTVMVALGAEMVAASRRGERTIPAADFYRFHLATALEPDELLTKVRLPPLPARTFGAFTEVARRKGDFALVGTAVVARIDPAGRAESVRIVCSGVAPTPFRVDAAAGAAEGRELSDEVLMDVQDACYRSLEPADDVHASGEYRRRVASVIVRRALGALRAQAGGGRG